MLKLTKRKTKKQKYSKREVGVSHFIPYLCHWNENTILTKNKELMQVIKVEGFSFETADDDDVDIRKDMRNMLFKGLASGGYELNFHIIRRREDIVTGGKARSLDPNIKIQKGFAQVLKEDWDERYSKKQAFINELYVTIIKKADTKGAAIFEYLLKRFMAKTDRTVWENEMRDKYDELSEVTGRIKSTLEEYGPKILSIKETPEGTFCEILEFLAKIVNCGVAMPMLVPTMDIAKYLGHTRLYFGPKAVEVRGAIKSRYAGIVSIKEYGPSTSAGIMDGFLQMPFEFIMSQSFSFANRQVSINSMQLQQNRMIQAEDKAVSQVAEISQALDMATSGDIAFGEHHLTVLCIADNPKSLESILSSASVEMFNAGVQPVRERVNLEPAFWGQLPSNRDYLVRRATVNTLNLASFASLHNFPMGKAKDNYWGDAVTVFDTTSGTPYYFSFHVRDVGHSLIIGPTGAGKTVLMNFLSAMSTKFDCRMFFFDKDRGAEIFVRAIGGNYTVIDPSKKCNFNPLQLPDTGDNRNFLLGWFKLLVTVNGEEITSEEITTLTEAVAGNYKLAKKDRVLRNVVAFLGMDGAGSLASRISMWHSGGSHATVFDNDEDLIDFTKFMRFGFEMGVLLSDSASLGPVLLYLFHRIRMSLDGSRTMIVLDEAWALIDNPIFGPTIKDWLKVLRKLNTFVVFATQSVEDAAKSKISDTLIQQTATQIFLPNLKATDVYMKSFMLSEREYTLIKTTDPGSRFFLIKQGTNAVIARLDLSGMTDVINILSGSAETVVLLDKIRARIGDDPEDWMPIFLEEAKKL